MVKGTLREMNVPRGQFSLNHPMSHALERDGDGGGVQC